MDRRRLLALLASVVSAACADATTPPAEPSAHPTSARAPRAAAPAPQQVVVETLPVPGDQPIFVLRGGREAGVVGVVLHGWCSHGMGFLQAFQWAAADVGRFIALQGDHRCGAGPMRGWSNDVAGLDRRIDGALRSYLGHEPPSEIVLVGSSQGAERAVALARRYPTKYRSLILSSGPGEVSPAGLQRLRGAYLLVGQYEGHEAARRSRDALRGAGLASELHVIQGGGHADFHGQGDALLNQAFGFLGISATAP
jgi:pimeloyl-ACP methyl ester carboxylesterase